MVPTRHERYVPSWPNTVCLTARSVRLCILSQACFKLRSKARHSGFCASMARRSWSGCSTKVQEQKQDAEYPAHPGLLQPSHEQFGSVHHKHATHPSAAMLRLLRRDSPVRTWWSSNAEHRAHARRQAKAEIASFSYRVRDATAGRPSTTSVSPGPSWSSTLANCRTRRPGAAKRSFSRPPGATLISTDAQRLRALHDARRGG